MATVYLARRNAGGQIRNVAVKKPHAFLARDPATVSVLEDEAQLGACINHPNVVGVIELVCGDEPLLVMEWIDGIDLGKLMRIAAQAGCHLPLDVVAAIARDVLAGLHAAHESRHADGRALDVVHRDVSPQNVIIGFDGSARITDFGVAKAAFRRQHTVDGTIKGKLGYLAPEQLTGSCDRRADVYSVGAVLWELLTSARMRKGNGVEVLVEILSGRVEAPSESAPGAVSLDAVVMRALERCPEERFATAEVMREALERAVMVASKARVAQIVRALVAGERGDERGLGDVPGQVKLSECVTASPSRRPRWRLATDPRKTLCAWGGGKLLSALSCSARARTSFTGDSPASRYAPIRRIDLVDIVVSKDVLD